MKTIIIGTRGSKLAMIQTDLVLADLKRNNPGITCEKKVLATRGDRIIDQPLVPMNGKGLFTSDLEKALSKGEIDIAVHSLKDLPMEMTSGITIGAYCFKEKPNDIVVSFSAKSLDSIPAGGVIATGSERRRLQIKRLRPDITFTGLRGNIETRLQKLEESGWDAFISNWAAFTRLGCEGLVSQILPCEDVYPAPGQGIIAVQCRADDQNSTSMLATIDNSIVRYEAVAQRSLLAAIDGCPGTLPGCYTTVDGDTLELHGCLINEGDTVAQYFESSVKGSMVDADVLGKQLAADLQNMAAG
jgi:hydroxymethylbilane synthase